MRYRISNAYQIFKSKFNHIQHSLLAFMAVHFFHLWLLKSVNPLLRPIWDPVFPSWYGIVFPSAQTRQERVLICILEISDNALHCRTVVETCLRNGVSFVLRVQQGFLPHVVSPVLSLLQQDEFSVWDMYQPTRTGFWLKAVWDTCPTLVMGWPHCLGYRQQLSSLWKCLSVFHHNSFFTRLSSAQTYTWKCE